METIISLWCPTCQRGPGKLNENNIYDVGDTCPMCLAKGRAEFSDKLMDVKEYERQILETAEFKKNQAAKRAPKSIKGPDQMIKDLDAKYQATIIELKQEIASLKKPITKTKKPAALKEVGSDQSS